MAIGYDRVLQHDPRIGSMLDGTLQSPGLAFKNEVGTGFYRPASGQVALAIKGVQVALWSNATSGVGAQLFPDGTVGAPGIAFALDTDSGVYRIGANNIGIAVNGVKSLDISTTSVSFLDGLVATPGMAFYSDLDSGFNRIGANNIGMALGGTQVANFAIGSETWTQASADTDAFDINIYKTRGSIASPTVITVGDELGRLNFGGYSGAGGYVIGAAIRVVSTGTIATTRIPASLVLMTGTDAAPTVLTDRVTIDNAGSIKFHAYGLGLLHSSATGVLTSSTVVDADVSASAAITPNKFNLSHFSARRNTSATNVTGNNTAYTALFDTADVSNAAYATGTGIYTAPATGTYVFHVLVNMVAGGSAQTNGIIQLVTTARTYRVDFDPYTSRNLGSGTYSKEFTVIVSMTLNDTAKVVLTIAGGPGDSATFGAGSVFSGCRIN